MSSATGLVDFYSGKNFFITGGSGFLGICLIEKILRSIPEHGTVYLLMRPKRGKEIAERLEEIKSNKIFEKLLEQSKAEEVFSKVKAVAGDVGQENMGLSAADRKLLTDNVNVIIHSAATLDFNDTLKTTVDINLLGTRRITELAKQCTKLKVLIHVSSAYVNAWRLDADEVVYPLPVDSEEVIALVNKLSPEELEEKTPGILGTHPNTYTITKHMAEHEIVKVQGLFPCTIIRPSMITGAWKEPVPGWTISKNGPQGFLMGASKGVIRRLPVAKSLVYDYIPVDTVVNNMLAGGFHAAATQAKTVQVYHSTSSTRNPFRWEYVEARVNNYLHAYPLKSAVWYPYLKLVPSITWYKISAFFVHILPAIFLDLLTRATGGRPILMKMHRNVNASLGRLEKFIFTEWKFSAVKTGELQDWLNAKDRNNFNLDISSLKWENYFVNLTMGVRIYLNKEPMKNLQAAKSKDNLLFVIHLLFQTSILTLLWYIFARLAASTMWQCAYVMPVLYILFNLL